MAARFIAALDPFFLFCDNFRLFYLIFFPFDMNQVVKILASAEGSTKVINSADEEGWAPIHSAASIGNLEIMETLLDRGSYFCNCLIFLMSSFIFSYLQIWNRSCYCYIERERLDGLVLN